jgi:rhodanese-related sulfurtransferase
VTAGPTRDAVDVRTAHDLHERGAVVLLDVREPEEWAAGHAPGALHVPLGELDADRIGRGEVVAVCRSGNRSGRAAVALERAGVPVRNMTGGMQAWAEAGLPVVTADGGAGTVA